MAPAANLIYNPMPQLNLITSFFFSLSHVFTQGQLHIIKVYQHEFEEDELSKQNTCKDRVTVGKLIVIANM